MKRQENVKNAQKNTKLFIDMYKYSIKNRLQTMTAFVIICEDVETKR